MLCTLLAAAVGASLTVSASQRPTQPADKWAPLRFLLGKWEGTSTGQPGKGSVTREYRLVLRDQFIEVRNRSVYPSQEKNPKGEIHEDIGYISYDRARKAFVFRQFHIEGFVNTYLATAGMVTAEKTVFESDGIENIPAGWRAREAYRLLGDGELVKVFELAPPQKDFAVYSETRLRAVR